MLSDLQGHPPTYYKPFEMAFLYSCAAVDKLSTDTKRGTSVIAKLLVSKKISSTKPEEHQRRTKPQPQVLLLCCNINKVPPNAQM